MIKLVLTLISLLSLSFLPIKVPVSLLLLFFLFGLYCGVHIMVTNIRKEIRCHNVSMPGQTGDELQTTSKKELVLNV